jgi:hypothetical protein
MSAAPSGAAQSCYPRKTFDALKFGRDRRVTDGVEGGGVGGSGA